MSSLAKSPSTAWAPTAASMPSTDSAPSGLCPGASGAVPRSVAITAAGPRTKLAKRAYRPPTNPQITRNATSARIA